jgi:dienelactone hydrolase
MNRLAMILGAGLSVGFFAQAANPAPKHAFSATTPAQAAAWQAESRSLLFRLMKIDDLQATRQPGGATLPFDVKELRSEIRDKYVWKEIELASTTSRRIKAVVTIPNDAGKHPTVVCIHGHGGNRNIVHDRKSLYRGFAAELAERGFVTIATDVGQHELADKNRTLAGERLWDLLRCADYAASLPEVDTNRMGCSGLSLGGEMAMWLGAMELRIKATVSSGFLTNVVNMRDGHCPCWEFPGLTDQFDFADTFTLIAPRALMCQNGQRETTGGGFPVDIAQRVMTEIQHNYAVFDRNANAKLDVHPEGHVFVVPTAIAFLEKELKK